MARLAGGKTEEDIRRFLETVHFPAHKDDLVHAARKNGAPNDIVSSIEQIPVNEFADMGQLLQAYPHLD